jgi:hypothetical protein
MISLENHIYKAFQRSPLSVIKKRYMAISRMRKEVVY